MYGIVYIARNLITGRFYVGQTKHPLSIRWSQHEHEAFKRKPRTYFHKALARYGWEWFKVQTVAIARDAEHLNQLEALWIILLRSSDRRFGYNLTYGGVGCSPSEETRRKMSNSAKLRCTPEWRRRIADVARRTWKGKPKTSAQRLKISAAHKALGTTPNEKCRQAVAEANRRRARQCSLPY